MSWTDERVTLLKRLWGEGKTAAEIAKELGGVTRNAVIGKAHRLKLSSRVSPIQQNKKPLAPVKTPPRKIEKIQAQDDQREKVSLVDLKAGQCRWPIGDPKEDNFGFCSDPVVPGMPYCMEHAQMAYQAATRNRLLQSQKEVKKAVPKSLEKTKKVANR